MKPQLTNWPARLGVGLLAGLVIVYVDNCTFEGEVSPIVIVALLLAATTGAGVLFRRSGWISAAVAWACVPLAHLIKHVLGWPDTLHPNTYVSSLYLALFTLAIAAIGTGGGLLIRKLTMNPVRPTSALPRE
jgi:hypothetical protein